MDKIRLVVYNEYALGYIMPQQPDKVCTLADRTTLGAPFRTMLEPYFIGKNDTRKACWQERLRHVPAIVRGVRQYANVRV